MEQNLLIVPILKSQNASAYHAFAGLHYMQL